MCCQSIGQWRKQVFSFIKWLAPEWCFGQLTFGFYHYTWHKFVWFRSICAWFEWNFNHWIKHKSKSECTLRSFHITKIYTSDGDIYSIRSDQCTSAYKTANTQLKFIQLDTMRFDSLFSFLLTINDWHIAFDTMHSLHTHNVYHAFKRISFSSVVHEACSLYFFGVCVFCSFR